MWLRMLVSQVKIALVIVVMYKESPNPFVLAWVYANSLACVFIHLRSLSKKMCSQKNIPSPPGQRFFNFEFDFESTNSYLSTVWRLPSSPLALANDLTSCRPAQEQQEILRKCGGSNIDDYWEMKKRRRRRRRRRRRECDKEKYQKASIFLYVTHETSSRQSVLVSPPEYSTIHHYKVWLESGLQ